MFQYLFGSPLQTGNMLSWWQWSLLAAIPPAIVLLYFLKLKRQPLVVPSTYLWKQTVEDLHVNSIWQRLRRNLLLLLQLLMIALLMLALLRPFWRGARLSGDNFVFLIDNSASMSTIDDLNDAKKETRLQKAKNSAFELLDAMKSGDRGMIVTFGDIPRVVQESTDNRRLLKQRLESITPSLRSTKIDEALLVSTRLANPERQAFDEQDNQVAQAMPATLIILSDGKFPDIDTISLSEANERNLFEYRAIGSAEAANLAITSFEAQRNEQRAANLQAFARLENYSGVDQTVDVELYIDNASEPIDVKSVAVPKGGASGVQFNLRDMESGVLKLRLDVQDALAADNVAWTTVNKPRKARVALVTLGNPALQLALSTKDAQSAAQVETFSPSFLSNEEFQKKGADGVFDLIIYDRCVPLVDPDESKVLLKMPKANTWFVDALPPVQGWSMGPESPAPIVIDVAGKSHPIMQFVDIGPSVHFLTGKPLSFPPGGRSLLDTTGGVMLAIAPREGFEDCVLSLSLVQDVEGRPAPATDWITKLAFPVYVHNTLRYLTSSQADTIGMSVQPGKPILVQSEAPTQQVQVRSPSGKITDVRRGAAGGYLFTSTDELGVYEILEGGQVTRRFAVNLFDSQESDVRTRLTPLALGPKKVAASVGEVMGRVEGWRYLIWLALGVILFEWYVYNRRVYL